MRRPRAVRSKQHGRRWGQIQSRMHRVLQSYKLRRVCCFVESCGGQFLSSANVESRNGKVPYVVAGDWRAVATITVLRGQCGTDVRMTKGRAKGRDQNRKQRKQRRDPPALHIKSTSQRYAERCAESNRPRKAIASTLEIRDAFDPWQARLCREESGRYR